jgi:hypothetical protein
MPGGQTPNVLYSGEWLKLGQWFSEGSSNATYLLQIQSVFYLNISCTYVQLCLVTDNSTIMRDIFFLFCFRLVRAVHKFTSRLVIELTSNKWLQVNSNTEIFSVGFICFICQRHAQIREPQRLKKGYSITAE